MESKRENVREIEQDLELREKQKTKLDLESKLEQEENL